MAIIIIIYHMGHFSIYMEGRQLPLYWLFGYFYRYGHVCVEAFFIISGFVIEYTYGSKLPEMTFGQFMKRRVQRLYPLFILTTLITAGLQLIFFQLTAAYFCHPVSLWGLFLNIVGLQAVGFADLTFNGPAWYVGTLVWMYVIYYYIHRSKYGNGKYVACVIIGGIIVCGNYQWILVHVNMARGLVGFFVGVLLCKYYSCFRVTYHRLTFYILAVSILLILIYRKAIIGDVRMFSVLVFWPAFLLYSFGSMWVSKFLCNRVFLFLGEISYDLLLWHFPLEIIFACVYYMGVIPGFHIYSVLFFISRLIITLLISCISYKYWDARLLKWFDKMLYFNDSSRPANNKSSTN